MHIFNFNTPRLNVIKRLKHVYSFYLSFETFINPLKRPLAKFIIINNRNQKRT